MKLVIDSNILVSSLDPKDVFHFECYPIFERLLGFEIEAFCPVTVLIETICALRRRINSEEIACGICKDLTHLPSINWLDVSLEVAERACVLGAKTRLKGGDAIVLQVAEHYGIPILTKDKEMKKRASKGILVFEPIDLA